MKLRRALDVSLQNVTMEGSHGCQVRWLVGESEGAPNFAMRQFEVAPGGYTPRHSHPYEHEVYILQGAGIIIDGDREHPLRPGDVVYVAPNDIHQFRNTGSTPLKFLCMVPHAATATPNVPPPECGCS